ncbi:9916_t:CDS:2, partial [Scutellospora calospora]
LLSGISNIEIQEIWEVSHIAMNSTSKPHYVVILKDSTLLCTSQGIKSFTSVPLYHIDQIRSVNVYTSNIKENINKKLQFGTTMSVAKTSVQIALSEGITAELIGILTQFITKYHRTTRLGIEETHNVKYEKANDSIVESRSNSRQLLIELDSNCNLIEVSNPEYHKPKGRPPKRLKSFIEENKQHMSREQRT